MINVKTNINDKEMEESRQKMMIDYINYIQQSSTSFSIIGKKVCFVQQFLNSPFPIDRNGFRQYFINNTYKIRQITDAKEAILEFMSFIGVGYNRKKRTIKPLKEIGILSKENEALIGRFIDDVMQKKDYSDNTIKSLRHSMIFFFKHSTSFDLCNCKRFIKTLEEKKYSARTICSYIFALSCFGNFVKKPVDLKKPKITKSLSTDNVPTEEEYYKFIEHLKSLNDKRYYFYVRIIASTGVRYHEFLKITWEDIIHGEVIIRGKGNKYRRVFFPKSLREDVKHHIKQTGITGLVGISRDGTQLNREAFSAFIKKHGENCGINRCKMHAHAFRHFFAKMYLKKNKGDIIQLAEFLGHSKIDTTMIYLQKSYEEQKRNFNRSVVW